MAGRRLPADLGKQSFSGARGLAAERGRLHLVAVPRAALAQALASDTVRLTVGGITERFKRDQLEALRDLPARVGAWPASKISM
jgi:hypothetical protein